MPVSNETSRAEIAASVLDNWATAIRGDWASIDGRACRTELGDISAFLRGETDTLTPEDVGVCMKGDFGAHWDTHWPEDHHQ